jgi:RimJ/RimL family protein N-acetyltransferase
MMALLNRAFLEYAAEAVSLVVFPGNDAAIRCYTKAGFIELGEERKFFESTRTTHEFLRMGIDAKQFRKLRQKRFTKN